jgi:hypothetical protein
LYTTGLAFLIMVCLKIYSAMVLWVYSTLQKYFPNHGLLNFPGFCPNYFRQRNRERFSKLLTNACKPSVELDQWKLEDL